jgi:hypothetical protein
VAYPLKIQQFGHPPLQLQFTQITFPLLYIRDTLGILNNTEYAWCKLLEISDLDRIRIIIRVQRYPSLAL